MVPKETERHVQCCRPIEIYLPPATCREGEDSMWTAGLSSPCFPSSYFLLQHWPPVTDTLPGQLAVLTQASLPLAWSAPQFQHHYPHKATLPPHTWKKNKTKQQRQQNSNYSIATAKNKLKDLNNFIENRFSAWELLHRK